jgi:hypothetical protein
MKTTEKNLAIAAIVIALIAVLLAFAAFKGITYEGVGNGPMTVVGTKTTGGTLGITYDEAIELYGDYRFQFVDCHGTPGSINMAAGSTFLLDNRDAEAHTIKVGSTSYSVAAYGFRVAKAPKAGTYNITCDGGGAATLKVQ